MPDRQERFVVVVDGLLAERRELAWRKWRGSSTFRVRDQPLAPKAIARAAAGSQISYQRSALKGLTCHSM
jgi:hypothetical protein